MQGDRVSIRRIQAGTAAAALLMGLLAAHVAAQPNMGSLLPTPRITVVTPCGGKVGTTVEVTFTGTDLNEPKTLLFSHPAIKAVPIAPPAPKIDPKAPKKGKGRGMKKPAPQVTKFAVTIPPTVPAGNYDVRLVGEHGVSNPRVFVVGELAEAMEKEPNNDVEQAQRLDVGTTVSGAINAPTDVDYYVVGGKKGQRLVVHCAGASIDSRISPELKLYDAAGRQVASHRPPPGTDALVDYTLPEDGDYYIRLCQFTYTLGNAEYFYRLSVSTAPWIDAVFPAIIEPGKTSKITLYGRNLPGGKLDPSAVLDGRTLEALTVDVTAPKDPAALQRLGYSGHVAPVSAALDGFEYRLKTPAGTSNPVPLFFAKAPVVLEKTANDTQETAQEIPLPCEVAGRIEKRRDRDWYVFTAKKGDVYSIHLDSHRLGAPTDMFLAIYNATGKQVTEMVQLDDDPQTLSPNRLYTLTRDPATYRFVAPADGKYYVLAYSHLGDTLAGPEHIYRLRIAPERPDFRLIVMPPDTYRPDTCILNKGGNRHYSVYAQRLDGFKGEITLSFDKLPAGVTARPQVIGPNRNQTNFVLSAADNAADFIGEVKVKGTAVVKGTKIEREARPATITWPVQPQQNIPTVTRLDRSLLLVVHGKAPYRLTLGKDTETLTHGGKVVIPVKLKRILAGFKAQLQIQPSPQEYPQGMTFGALTIPAGKDEGNITLNVPANVPPGTYNFVLRGFAPVALAPKGKTVNVEMPSTPLTLVVLPKQVATLSVSTTNPTVKLGKDFNLVVKVNRKFDFEGEFKVSLELPKGAEGVTATSVVIPAGQNEAKLVLHVPTSVRPGNRPNLIVRAVAMVNGNVAINHETKINVNITK